MRKRLIPTLIVITMLLSITTIIPTISATPFTPITGLEMMEKLGMGINIGNTLEARPWADNWWLTNHMDTETSWSAPKIEAWQFEAIAAKGFNNVRIPVTWEVHMDENGRIYDEWMDRVQECVNWALEAGLYVTINTHHEKSSPDSFYELIDTGRMAQAEAWLLNTWTQIAERFADYSEKLIFEPFNEPNRAVQGGWIWSGCWEWMMTDLTMCLRILVPRGRAGRFCGGI